MAASAFTERNKAVPGGIIPGAGIIACGGIGLMTEDGGMFLTSLVVSCPDPSTLVLTALKLYFGFLLRISSYKWNKFCINWHDMKQSFDLSYMLFLSGKDMLNEKIKILPFQLQIETSWKSTIEISQKTLQSQTK